MDNQDNSGKLSKYVSDRAKYDEKVEKGNGKRRLNDVLKKMLTTLMIGSIAEFEKHFGEDWGHGLSDDERNDDQLDDKAVWNQCREKVMDLGNRLIKEMTKELSNYNVEAVKYQLKFYPKKD